MGNPCRGGHVLASAAETGNRGYIIANEAQPESGGKAFEAELGVLFVHGIGQQQRGETLLKFGEPLIAWLDQWSDANGESLSIERVDVDSEHDAPQRVLVSNSSAPREKILLAESWWASKFKPPSFYELTWWLLLVGTWATFSHANKPLSLGRTSPYDLTVATFRALLYYTPIALSYQLLIFVLALLGSLPLTPWRDFFVGLLLTLSRTLGDSFVLIHSPTQQRMAIDTILSDLDDLKRRCRRVLVVAHSQGAAICFDALHMADSRSNQCRVSLVTVGSGLDKLTELRTQSAALDFRARSADMHEALNCRGREHTDRYRSALYFSPLAFIAVWGGVLGYVFADWPVFDTFFVAIIVVSLLWCSAFYLFTFKPTEFLKPRIARWIDIFASSDPVSNGPVKGPDESIEIVNHRSLLEDHTAYFANRVDFIPRSVNLCASLGRISWLQQVEAPATPDGATAHQGFRRMRKQLLLLGKWFNRIGAVYFAYLLYGSSFVTLFRNVRESVELAVAWLFGDKPAGTTLSHWVYALLIYGAVEIFLRWSDRTSERTEPILLFRESRMLYGVRIVLAGLVLAAPLLTWVLVIGWWDFT